MINNHLTLTPVNATTSSSSEPNFINSNVKIETIAKCLEESSQPYGRQFTATPLKNDKSLYLFFDKTGSLVKKPNNEPVGVASLDDYRENDKSLLPSLRYTSPPLVEVTSEFNPELIATQSDHLLDVTHCVNEWMLKKIADKTLFIGPNGSRLSLLKIAEKQYIVTSVGNISSLKPSLCSSLCVYFKALNKEREEIVFTMLGTRKTNPGLGKGCFMGNFTLIRKTNDGHHYLPSPLFSILQEGKEEGGMEIRLDDPEKYRTDYDATRIDANVYYGPKFVDKKTNEKNYKKSPDGNDRPFYNAKIVKIGTIPTGDDIIAEGGEKIPNGPKRVYQTTGYAVMVDLKDKVVDLADTSDPFFKDFKFAASTEGDYEGLTLKNITAAVKGQKSDVNDLLADIEFGIYHQERLMEAAIPILKKEFNIIN